MNFKPLLADDADLNNIEFGNVYGSPKLDGIRAIVRDGVVYSRSLKRIPNRHVQSMFGHLEHYDGELIVGPPNGDDVYNVTYSGVMSADGQPEAMFYAFDHIQYPELDYVKRLGILLETHNVRVLPQTPLLNLEHLLDFEAQCLNAGYEGIMIRKGVGPQSRYKFGRSTAKQGTLLKLKRMKTSEAVVIGVEEEMHNGNEAALNELGHTKRSSHKENLVGKGRLGALVCRRPDGVEFRIGTGFTQQQRIDFWKEDLLGRLVSYNHFPIGELVAPRFPSFKGWRSTIDVSGD